MHHNQAALFTLPLFFPSLVFTRSYNITIDDQMGDPATGQQITYSPPDMWNNGQTCERCTAKPSPADNAYMGTWKDASFIPHDDSSDVAGQIISATVPFTGTAVYVNCILTGSATGPDGNTDMTFEVDNITVGSFEQSPNNDGTYHFGVTVFSMTGLENAMHTLALESGHAGKKALVLLDSIIYTKEVEDATSSSTSLSSMIFTQTSTTSTASTSDWTISASSSRTSAAVIAGSVVGGTIAATTILSVAFICHRRQRRPRSGVRVVLDTSDVPSPRQPYTRYSSNSPNHLSLEDRGIPFVICSPSVPTLVPGDSVSQVNSDHTSDWTSTMSHGGGRRTFRERARAFALSRGRASNPLMKVQNVTEADIPVSDVYDDVMPPVYLPSKLGNFNEEKS